MKSDLRYFNCIFVLLLSIGLSHFAIAQRDSLMAPLTYLALGDSYTIGESVETNKRWPVQLKNQLNENGIGIEEPLIIAKTGWRTDEMLAAAQSELNDTTFDIVSLLIGVNNEFQGKTPESFEVEFEQCLEYAISTSKRGNKGVFVMSIPDYGYTPFGMKKQEAISKRIDAYNAICKRISQEKGVLYINITDLSRRVKEDDSLVANDELHPSAEQYALWVQKAIDKVERLLISN